MAYHCSPVPQMPPMPLDSTGEWIALYYSSEDENDQIIIEPFHVYICGPAPQTPVPLQAATVPARSCRYSDSTANAAEPSVSALVTVLDPRPRNQVVVVPGLSTRSTTVGIAAPAAWEGMGVLTQHKRLHLQSWLNDCRRCSGSGIHTAVFGSSCGTDGSGNTAGEGAETDARSKTGEGPSWEDFTLERGEPDWQTIYLATPPGTPRTLRTLQPPPSLTQRHSKAGHERKFVNADPVSLAALISSTLRSPLSSSSFEAGLKDSESIATAVRRRKPDVEAQRVSRLDSSPSQLARVELAAAYSPSMYSSPTEADVYVHVDTPWAAGESLQRRGAFIPPLAAINSPDPHLQQPQSGTASRPRVARSDVLWPVVKPEPAPCGRSRRGKDNFRECGN